MWHPDDTKCTQILMQSILLLPSICLVGTTGTLNTKYSD